MDEFSISGKIPENFCRYIVNCIDVALSDDYKRYVEEFHPDTTNGVPHCIYDWINGNIVRYIPQEFRVIQFNRYSWKSKMIIDDENKIVYTVMSEKSLKRIKRKSRISPHYLQTFVSILNAELKSQTKQLTLDGFYPNFFTQDTLNHDFEHLCGESINATDGYKHCLIAFNTEIGQLSSVSAWVLDKDLDIVDSYSLNEYIKSDYSNLTNMAIKEEIDKLPQNTPNAGLLSFTNKSLVKIKEVTKRG